MKKQFVTAFIVGFIILTGSFTTVAIKNANATPSSGNTTLALESTTLTTSPLALEPIQITPRHQTIYALTDDSGNVDQSFTNNTLNSSDAALPLSLEIRYYLDGIEIHADDLAGQSGHVRIEYHYTSTKTYQNKLIPFVALTGTILDGDKFNNLKLENGKIISDDHNIAIVGYSLVGLNENLGTDFLPNIFAFEADVTNFALDSTYTIATSELFASIDTKKLTSIDELKNSVNQLASGLDQLLTGASQLNEGLSELSSGLHTLKAKTDPIADKILSITTNINTALNSFNSILNAGRESIDQIPTNSDFINQAVETFAAKHDLTAEAVAELEAIIAEKYSAVYTTFSAHLSKIDSTIINSTTSVASYINQIESSTRELRDGIAALTSGADQLYTGSTALKNGLYTFKTQGIDRLVNFANHDLDSFVRNLRQTITAAASYHSYDNSSTESVKFVFKTPAIK